MCIWIDRTESTRDCKWYTSDCLKHRVSPPGSYNVLLWAVSTATSEFSFSFESDLSPKDAHEYFESLMASLLAEHAASNRDDNVSGLKLLLHNRPQTAAMQMSLHVCVLELYLIWIYIFLLRGVCKVIASFGLLFSYRILLPVSCWTRLYANLVIIKEPFAMKHFMS